MEGFKLFGGTQIEDVGQYVLDYVIKYPDTMVFIGTDSTQLRKQTLYATAVVLYHPGSGAHIIYKRTRLSKVKDLFTRLWKEVELTREVAEYVNSTITGTYTFEWNKDTLREYKNMLRMPSDDELREANIKLQSEKLIFVDLDFNPSENHKSNVVHDAGVGTLKGLGYRVRTKPTAYAATCAADLVCKF